MAESWHMVFSKTINPAKSRYNEFRFETFRTLFFSFLSVGFESLSRYTDKKLQINLKLFVFKTINKPDLKRFFSCHSIKSVSLKYSLAKSIERISIVSIVKSGIILPSTVAL